MEQKKLKKNFKMTNQKILTLTFFVFSPLLPFNNEDSRSPNIVFLSLFYLLLQCRYVTGSNFNKYPAACKLAELIDRTHKQLKRISFREAAVLFFVLEHHDVTLDLSDPYIRPGSFEIFMHWRLTTVQNG